MESKHFANKNRFRSIVFGTIPGLMFIFAEHNGSYAAAYKNILDWSSRIDAKVFQEKPIII